MILVVVEEVDTVADEEVDNGDDDDEADEDDNVCDVGCSICTKLFGAWRFVDWEESMDCREDCGSKSENLDEFKPLLDWEGEVDSKLEAWFEEGKIVAWLISLKISNGLFDWDEERRDCDSEEPFLDDCFNS